jgi:hypothetical protein
MTKGSSSDPSRMRFLRQKWQRLLKSYNSCKIRLSITFTPVYGFTALSGSIVFHLFLILFNEALQMHRSSFIICVIFTKYYYQMKMDEEEEEMRNACGLAA